VISKTISVMAQIILVIGIVGMWVTLGKALWLFFMAISVISIIVYFITGG